MTHSLLFIHVCGAVLGLLSGFIALAFRKGSGWHGAVGTVFFVSMLVMTTTAAYVAIFLRPIMINVVVATLTFYLVATAWRAAKRREGKPDLIDLAGLLFVLMVGIAGVGFGFLGASSPERLKGGVPVAVYFIFGSAALLFGVSDIRMFRRGGLFGTQRIARHLWRMCFALLIATISFFPGQARLFPKWLKATNLLYVPHVLLIGAMLFWLYRVKVRRRVQQERVVDIDSSDRVVTRMVA